MLASKGIPIEERTGDDVVHSISQASVVSDHSAASLSRSFHEKSGLLDGSFSSRKKSNHSSLTEEQDPPVHIPFSVWVMYIVSAICQCAQTLTEFIAWFVIKSRGWAKDANPAFYGLTYAISSFVPVIMNPILGWISYKTSIRCAMIAAMSVSITGMIVMTYAYEPLFYAVGYFMYACAAIRPLRTAYIAQATDARVRTRCIAYLNLWTDASKMMGLLCAKIWDRLAPATIEGAAPWVILDITLDRLNLSLLSSIVLFMIGIATLVLVFREEAPSDGQPKDQNAKPDVEYTRLIEITEPDGTKRMYDGESHALGMSLMFCVIFLCHQMTCGSVSVSNLPVLTERFQQDGDQAASTKLLQDVIGMPTPLLVAWLSNSCSDRALFLSGILLAWTAIGVFACPPAFTVYQPLLGMGIGHASQTFFFTAGFSMFSKVMGVRNNGARVATMASFAAMGSTLGSLIGGRYTMSIYGTWWFYLTLVPSGIALLLLLTPRFWERLHPLHYITKQVNDAWENDMKKQVAVW